MPRVLKGFLHLAFSLAILGAFMYPRMGPLIRSSIRQSRAMKAQNGIRRAPGSGGQSGRAMTTGAGEPGAESEAPRERIVSFASDVTLRKNAALEIREEFVVHSEADYFRYGLIRRLPIDSEARWDSRLVGPYAKDTGIRVKILEATEDGARVSYDQGSDSAYEQLRIGPDWMPLPPGDHRFVLRYEADGVTQFLAAHDQLYWNSIGDYWRLPVDDAVLRVHLPPEVPAGVVAAEAYAGGRGQLPGPGPFGGTALERTAIPDGYEVRAANLKPTQSVSIVLTWPKGFLAPPALGPLSRDSGVLIAPAVLLLYYLVVWLALGRDPRGEAVAIQYQPPQGLSPAGMRYVVTTGCDGRTLAATLAQLAARGLLEIEPLSGGDSGKYKVTRVAGADAKSLHPALAPEELSLYAMLFEDGPEALLDRRNGNLLNSYLMRINTDVQKRLNNVYFTRNARWMALGALASFLSAVGMGLASHGRNTDRMTLLFLTWWFFFCFFLLGLISEMTLLPAWGRMIRGLGGAKEVLVGSLAVGAFAVGGGFVLWQLKSAASLAYAVTLAALVALNIAAFPALRRLTPLGREVRGKIEGFRQFLEKVEQDRLRRVDAADPHAATASGFLPYAIALELREPWGDHLAEACVVTTTR